MRKFKTPARRLNGNRVAARLPFLVIRLAESR